MNSEIDETKKCSHSKCNLEVFNNQNTCILHCKKDTWDEINDPLFWKEIRLLNIAAKNFFIFTDIIFPPFPIKHLSFTKEFKNSDYILEEDYLFWEVGQTKSFGNIAQFTNCTFYNFYFHYIESKTINFSNCTIEKTLNLNSLYIENIYILDSKKINNLEITTNHLNTLELKNSNIEKLEIKNIQTNFISLISLNLQTVIFNNFRIKEGIFQDLDIKNIENNATIFLDDIKKFFYKNVTVKKADREYFRFIKKIFTEKDDFINMNEMYKQEMDSYYKELLQNLKKRKNRVSTIQNFIVAGFAKFTSNFGESWFRPLILLIITSFFNVLCTNDYTLSYLFSGSGELWDKLAKSIYFFDKETFSIDKLIFNIIQALLIYQLIFSIKRKLKY